ncbi:MULTISPECIES: hypothetical protein [unclassified Pseudomonas]|uniref:hypothetical protein n=1 Tax=unclassified Pseudomonas TaxID=196821 RepID=UPI001AE9541B|nr:MULTISPECIES: hypothetical protein [unclassified Pseudomonas]MBP2273761.1 hypothetical protein [Pseudomonas sp. BP6]MBP2287268.1 hypothetical protein [Pseudomonas sp. BP7]HDS1696334.1 hypothetical protein [Pseudomonas putida]HDS1703379.1 hypothetical protein [Pseudomonas putida]
MDFPLIVKPGSYARNGLVMNLEGYYQDACYALISFEKAGLEDIEERANREFADEQLKWNIISEMVGQPTRKAPNIDIELQATATAYSQIIEQGRFPKSIELRIRTTYAKAFLYALDGYAKMVDALAKDLNSQDLKNIYDDFTTVKFPNLIQVRNSAHHVEDRARMLKAGNKPIVPQPFNGGGIFGGMQGVNVYVVDSLFGNKYTASLADGTVGEVEVSPKSLHLFAESLHTALLTFQWEGDPKVLP